MGDRRQAPKAGSSVPALACGIADATVVVPADGVAKADVGGGAMSAPQAASNAAMTRAMSTQCTGFMLSITPLRPRAFIAYPTTGPAAIALSYSLTGPPPSVTIMRDTCLVAGIGPGGTHSSPPATQRRGPD